MTHRVKNWQHYQHYKDRSPPWIKLHYELLMSRDWINWDDASRVLACAIMLLASRTEGEIDLSPAGLRYLERAANLNTPPDPQPLIECGFIVAIKPLAPRYQDASKMLLEKRRVREEEEVEEEKNLKQHGFLNTKPDKLSDSVDGLLDAPGPPSDDGAPTISGLVELAAELLGMGTWDADERKRATSIARQWEGRGQLENGFRAVEGLHLLRQRGAVEWLPAGKPCGLRALQHTHTLYDQGDGRAVRPLFDVAVEAYLGQTDTSSPRSSGLIRLRTMP